MQETNSPLIHETILDAFPDAVAWLIPVNGAEGNIIDFEVAYANNKAQEGLGHIGTIKGLQLKRDRFPSPRSMEEVHNVLSKTYRSGVQADFALFVPALNRTVDIQTQVSSGGILCISRDRVAQREAERREQKTTRTLKSIVSNPVTGIVVYESVRGVDGKILDFKLVLDNERSNELAGLSQDSDRSFRSILRNAGAEAFLERYIEVVEKGLTMQREQFLPNVQKWLSVSVSKLDDGFVSLLTDITSMKDSQREVELQSGYLDNILNTSLNAVVTMEAVRDNHGEIIDLRYTQANKTFLKILAVTKDEVIGNTMLKTFPATKDAGIYALYKTVIETGQARQDQIKYDDGEHCMWFDVSVAKLDAHAAVGTFMDITKSRQTQEQTESQKALLDNILKYSSNGISVPEVIRDENGAVVDVRTILVNDAAVRFTGLPKEVYLSKTAVELEPNILQTPYYQLCMKTLETGVPAVTQYQLESTGTWLEITISRMDADRLITVFTDITENKKAQVKMEQSAQKLRAVVDTSQAGIFTGVPVYDESGDITDFRFTLVNRALAAFTEQEPDSLIGELGLKWFGRYKSNGLFDAFKKTFETGNDTRFDFFYQGHKFEAWINIVIRKLEDEVIGTFTDFSSLKKTQQLLERTVEELQRSNANLEEFAYAASHDLKEPIRKVRIFSDGLSRSLADRLTDEEKSYFERMDRASTRMSHLIEDLLSYSQVSLIPATFEEVDMTELVNVVLSDLDLQAEEKGAVITVDPLFKVRGQARQLQQAFQNLIGNALKYTRPGVTPRISITCTKLSFADLPHVVQSSLSPGDFYKITVADNGLGFEQKDAERIFKVFTRLHSQAEFKGSGVGLSIVRKAIENHHGFVTVESVPGEGSRFMVFLPQ